MSPGKEAEINILMSTKTSIDDYENLCRLYVLSLTDIARDEITVLQDFKDQLRRSKEGWCKTALKWKDNSTSLQNSKLVSLRRLKNFCKIYREIKNYPSVMIRLLKKNMLKE